MYEETSGDMMVPEGGSAKLVCRAQGYPQPKILWRREDGQEIISRNATSGKTKCMFALLFFKKTILCFSFFGLLFKNINIFFIQFLFECKND